MKKIIYLLAVGLMIALFGCGSPTATTSVNELPAAVSVAPAKELTAEAICNNLKANGLPISNIVVYTADTDTNKLLGRPNQYISKANFTDARGSGNFGWSVEVFANPQDTKTRKEYLDSTTNGNPAYVQYMYIQGNVLLRVGRELTPSQAAEYEAALVKVTSETDTTNPASAPEKKWVAVKSWSGNGIKTTENFTITGVQWRINWTSDGSGGKDASILGITVAKEDGTPIGVAANSQGAGSDTTYEHEGAGTYNLKIIGANTGWKVSVEEEK